MSDDRSAPGATNAAPLLSSDDLARLRAEERARQEIRAALAPAPHPGSRFDKFIALLNTNVGIGTVAALLLSVGTWCYTVLDDHLHKAERQAARDSAKALVDVQQVSPFLPMLARPDSPERALACRVLAHMIASGSIDKTLGSGLASEAGNCLAEQARQQAASPAGAAEARSSSDAIRAVDRREAAARLAPAGSDASAPAAALAAPAEVNPAQAALASALPRRVYIQYADDSQLDEVKQLRAFYQAKGWIVPETERVGAKAPNKLQVRYFNPADAAAARQTQQDLSRMAPFEQQPQASEASYVNLNAPPGQLEVWLPQPR